MRRFMIGRRLQTLLLCMAAHVFMRMRTLRIVRRFQALKCMAAHGFMGVHWFGVLGCVEYMAAHGFMGMRPSMVTHRCMAARAFSRERQSRTILKCMTGPRL